MSQVPAGWFNDPYGRFQQRYWDGTRWTEHVAVNGQPSVDPMGASTAIPFAIPATALPESPASEPGTIALLERMAPTSRERPRPGLRAAVAGLGGVVVAGGSMLSVIGDSPSRGKFIGVSLGIIVLACLLRVGLPRNRAKLAEVASAALGMAVVGIAVFGVSATVTDGNAGFLTGLVLGALFLAGWFVPRFDGGNLFLALGLLFLLAAVGSLSSPDGSTGSLPGRVTDNIGAQGVIYVLGAALFLGVTWWLDHRGYRGTATAWCAAGLIAALIGTALFVTRLNSDSGPVLVTLVGVFVCLVGAHGGRRATTWSGAVLVALGITSFIVIQWKPSGNSEAGVALLVAGLSLVVLPMVGAAVRAAIGAGEPAQ